jgi:hypothetical protein
MLKKPTPINLLVISDEISPKWFGKHLLAMSLTKHPEMKVIILPRMKDHSNKLFKIPAIIWCATQEINSLDNFYKQLNIHNELLRHYAKIGRNRNVSIAKKKIKQSVEQKLVPITYLTKTSSSLPAFIPAAEKREEKMEVEENFISLAKFEDKALVEKKSPFAAYRPLKINKIIGNPKRKSNKSDV